MVKFLDEETTKKVIRQVEFYFSDSNLPRDSFLKKTVDESEDRLVSLSLICSFSRMRSHLGLQEAKPDDITDDTVKAVADALKSSTFLKISDDGKKIGRATELPKPEEVIEQIDGRTIAASPLEYSIKLEDVESFFGQYAKVNSVRLPRHVADKRLFCGTALVEFSSEEDVQSILKQSLLYAGLVLELKPKKDFVAERAEQEKVAENNTVHKSSSHKSQPNVEDNYPKGLIVSFKLKKNKEKGTAEVNGYHMPGTDNVEVQTTTKDSKKLIAEDDSNDEENNENTLEEVDTTPSNGNVNVPAAAETQITKEDEKEVNQEKESKDEEKCDNNKDNVDIQAALDVQTTIEENNDITVDKETKDEEEKNARAKEGDDRVGSDGQNPVEMDGEKTKERLSLPCKDDKDVVLRDDLKSLFGKFGVVKFVDFETGSDSGYIRFEKAETAQKARAAAVLAVEGGLVVKNCILTLDPVTGDAEKEYWNQFCGGQERRGGNYKGYKGRGKFRGGKHPPRHRDSNSGRPNKAQKVRA
ncbi:unnamed protein product [Cuscuta europaea]|uniref:La protein 1 n=1 Tax=Cuscuta europaea TaxID=41803 RepID=A0A9P0YST7_CUSEU|nr:unnamed protein product [Cuscuta europaea]